MISYDGRIKPLRDTKPRSLRPHTSHIASQDSSRDGKINHQEAVTVASLLCGRQWSNPNTRKMTRASL